MDPVYVIDNETVVSDVIGGEAVMLHRGSGDYFSTDGVGCLIWQWVGERQSRGWIVKTLNERFAAEQSEIETAVDAFLLDLLSHNLVREIGGNAGSAGEASIEPQREPEPAFARPVLHVYSDIRRMVLMDPIHEVAEAGWPNPKLIDGPA